MNKKAKKFDYVLAVIFVFLVIITIYPFLNVLAISCLLYTSDAADE